MGPDIIRISSRQILLDSPLSREIRVMQGSFPLLQSHIKYEDRGERRLILLTIVYLFNYRTTYVGINQILTLYMPETDEYTGSLFPNLLSLRLISAV